MIDRDFFENSSGVTESFELNSVDLQAVELEHAASNGVSLEVLVEEIQVVLPLMTPEELSRLESVSRASQDCEEKVNRLISRMSDPLHKYF